MSQNVHTLLLFFEEERQHQHACIAFYRLGQGDDEQALQHAQKLGLQDLDEWHEHWFNQQVTAHPEYLRIDFDTSTSYDLPLTLLDQLFSLGLKAAVVDTFNDQVGEFRRAHFLSGALVSQADLYAREPTLQPLIDELLEERDEEDLAAAPKPVSVRKLIADEQQRSKDAEEMIKGVMDLARHMNETGESPLEAVQSVLVRDAMFTSLKQALLFTVVTVLLFKGMWLWITLGILLLIGLTLFRTQQIMKDLKGGEELENAD
ncbi:MAG: hypothetical protein ACK4VV_02205 [Pseudomonas sp.]